MLMLRLTVIAAAFLVVIARPSCAAPYKPFVAPASDEAELAMKRFRLPKGFKVELFAAEPLLANPVAFCIDESGQFYVAETFRLFAGVTDIRHHMNWLNDDLASRSVEDRVAMLKRYEGSRISQYTTDSDRVRLIRDSDGDGRADTATVFAEDFNRIADGLGAGLLARKGHVYYANIPHLWLLQDKNSDGVAELKNSLHYGYGVRVGFIGHDLHGLCMGPDGKLYFSIGDRGSHIQLTGGRTIQNHETGAIYRCNPDGSDLEIFATGLRNPQELAFDDYGNLWTGENNSDGGDPARWVYLVEGGDCGWRIGFQFINTPNARGPWIAERMCYPQQEGQPAYILPPIANIGNGPSGLACYPGTGLPDSYKGYFFLCDFRGGTGSGVHSFTVKPKGASFEVADRSDFIWEVLVTDGDFGYDGCFYISDWVNGWLQTGKGRIYRVYHPIAVQDASVKETQLLIGQGFDQKKDSDLEKLLSHRDRRIRQEAQFSLAARESVEVLSRVAEKSEHQLARLHATWGLGQIAAAHLPSLYNVTSTLLTNCLSSDAEVRGQSAKVLGQLRTRRALNSLLKLLDDPEPRPRFFAAIALGKIGRKEAVGPLLEMLRENNNRDRYLRHAGIMGLVGCADASTLKELSKHESAAVRVAAVVALRRLNSPEVAEFLSDEEPEVVLEAARAVNDLPIRGAVKRLAEKIDKASEIAGQIPPVQPAQEVSPTAVSTPVDLLSALLRRIVNANYRLGGENHARALVRFVKSAQAPESLRSEALTLLGQWAKPSGRDTVTGLWRPIPARDGKSAAEALEPHLRDLFEASPAIRIAAIKAAAALKLESAGSLISSIARNSNQPPAVRVEALKGLAALKDTRLQSAVAEALDDANEVVRREAIQLQATIKPEDAIAQLTRALESGSTSEKQAALVALGNLTNSPVAAALLMTSLDKLLTGELAPELHLDILEAAAKRSEPEVQAKLRQFESARRPDDDLRSFRECFAGGNAELGRKIFLEKPEVSCVRCHKAGGEGGEVGPDLSGIGSRHDRQYLLEGIVFPNKQIAAGYESLLITLTSGVVYAGIVKSEDDESIKLNSPEDGLVTIKKSEIKSRERALSAMPEEFRQVLSKRELRDLIEFLASLK